MRIPPGSFAICWSLQILTVGLAQGQVLTHGPVVGGVTATTANVFVRTDQAASVVLRYGTDPNLATYLASATDQTSAANDFTSIIAISGLTPEATYYLNVVVNDLPQLPAPPYPSFATFPPAGVSRSFKFVVLADFRTVDKLTSDVPTFASAAAEFPAFAFIGGDFDHRNPNTLASKRKMFQDLYDANTPHMGDLANLILHKMAIIHQWDDHDSGLNNLDRTYVDWNLTQQVFEEYVPSYPLPSVTPGIWQKFGYAQADCFVLDCRSQRDPETDPDGLDKSMLDGNNLGATGELQWLKDGLLASTARWKIIFTSVVTNPTTKLPDGWAGYQTEWRALKDFITSNNIQGVVFISGDLHLGAIDNGTQAGFPEMCVNQPNGTGGGSCATSSRGTWSEGYYDDTCSGYGVVSVLNNPDRLVLQVADQDGNIHTSYTLSDETPTATPTPSPSPPAITTQPNNKTANPGGTAKFNVTATGAAPLSYQWRKNGINIANATKVSYTTPQTSAADNGALFSVVVSNAAGSVTSNNAKLTVRVPPSITAQPASKTVTVGKTPKFSVTTSGTTPLTYHWKKNGVDIVDATKASYTTPPTTLADNGALLSVIVSNKAGSVTSNNAVLTVNPSPSPTPTPTPTLTPSPTGTPSPTPQSF